MNHGIFDHKEIHHLSNTYWQNQHGGQKWSVSVLQPFTFVIVSTEFTTFLYKKGCTSATQNNEIKINENRVLVSGNKHTSSNFFAVISKWLSIYFMRTSKNNK